MSIGARRDSGLEPQSVPDFVPETDLLQRSYLDMLRIRGFEERAQALFDGLTHADAAVGLPDGLRRPVSGLGVRHAVRGLPGRRLVASLR